MSEKIFWVGLAVCVGVLVLLDVATVGSVKWGYLSGATMGMILGRYFLGKEMKAAPTNE